MTLPMRPASRRLIFHLSNVIVGYTLQLRDKSSNYWGLKMAKATVRVALGKPISSFHLAGVKGEKPTAPDPFILGLIKKALKKPIKVDNENVGTSNAAAT